jgi:hypothetical protein
MMRSDGPADARSAPEPEGDPPVEMIIGLALIVLAGLLIIGIIRTVQSNMGKG